MMTTLDRVAEAARRAHFPGWDGTWDTLSDSARDHWRHVARAVLDVAYVKEPLPTPPPLSALFLEPRDVVWDSSDEDQQDDEDKR